MHSIVFVDAEIDQNSEKVLDMGGVKENGSIFHSTSSTDFTTFLKGSEFICGHNILKHDLKYIRNAVSDAGIPPSNIIDTLFLSPLLFPARPYHALLKDDKLQTEDSNNPLNDSIKARDLFFAEVEAFKQSEESLKEIFYLLLHSKREFRAFFDFMGYTGTPGALSRVKSIVNKFSCDKLTPLKHGKSFIRVGISKPRPPFQFLYGAIKRPGSHILCIVSNTFQFLYGAIKRKTVFQDLRGVLRFQFLYGAIKRITNYELKIRN